QDGDNTFTRLQPSQVAVAGDPNDSGGNQVSPVYASFGNLIFSGDNSPAAPERTGQPVDQSLNRAGEVKTIAPLDNNLVYRQFEASTRHNIAGVFVDFFNLMGQV